MTMLLTVACCSGQYEISERVVAALAAVRARGGAVIVATGRPLKAAAPILSMAKLNVDYLLTNNGALCSRVAAFPKSKASTDYSEWIDVTAALVIPDGALKTIVPAIQAKIPNIGMSAHFYGARHRAMANRPVIGAYQLKLSSILFTTFTRG